MSILTWIEDKKRLKVLNAPKHSANSTDSSKGLWTRCDKCGVILYIKHLKENQRVCFSCSYHLQMMSGERIENLLDKNEPYGHANALPLLKKSTLRDAKANASNLSTWRPLDETVSPCDPLKFHDQKAYTDRLQDAQERTGLQDAIQTGTGMIDGIPVALAVMDFSFMGGSMGSVVGEKITRLIEYATGEGLTLLIVSASGGARMQEGVFSLMQMAKISSALQIYQSCAKLLYISILTSPTTGGVTASFAMLGDIIFAEPKALIAFAGRRVIEQTLCEDLPDDFQTSEYMLHHGLVDLIVPRRFLRQALSETIRLYQNAPFKKRGHIPFGVQNPITFLTEEKIRRGWSGLASPGTKVLSSNSSYFKANQNQNFNRLSLSNQSGSITKKFVTGSDKSELFKAKPKRMYREILTSFEIMLALFVSGNTKKQNASLQKTAPEKPLGDLSSSFTKRQTSEELGQIPTSFPRSTSTNRRFALRSKVSLRSPSGKEERRFVQPQRKQTQSPFWLYNNLILRASSTVDNKKFFNYQFISGQYRKNQPLYLILKNDFVSYTKQGFNLEEGIPSSKSLPTIFKSKLFLQNQDSKESSFYGNKAVAFTEGDRKNFVSSFCFANKSSICKPSAKPENQQSKTNSRFVAQRGKGKTIFDPKDKGYKYKSSISTTSVKINQNANRLGFCKSEASNFLSPSGIVAKANLTNSHKKAKNIAGESLQTTRFTWKNENGNVPTMESVSEKAFATQNRKALFSLKNRLSLSKFKEHSSFSKLLGIAFTKPCFFNFSQKDCKFLLFKRFLTSLKLASTHKSLAKNRLDLQQYDTSAMLSQNGAGKRFAPKSVGFSKFFETKLDSLSIRSVSKKNAPSRVLAKTTRILKNKQAKPSVRLKQRFVQQVLFDFGFYCSSAIKNANDKYTFVPHAAKKKSFREIYQSEGQTTLSSSNKSSKSLYPEKIREQNSAGINGEMPSSSLLYNFRFLAEATLESNGLQISNEDQSVGQGEPIISSERHIEQKTQAVQKQAFYGGEKKVNLIPGLNDTRFNRSAIGFKHTNYLCERALSFLQNKSKAHKGLDKKQSLMTPKSNTKISASSSLSSDFSRNPKNISSVFFISRSHFNRINIKSNSKNCSAASPIVSAGTKKGFKLGGSLGHANQNPNGLGFENQKTNQTININKSLSTAKKVSVTDFTSAENDIDFLNQAIELAATESVEWRAFYIHQQLSENTGFVDDFLQQEGVGKISKLDFLEPWFEKAGSTVGSEEPDFENQKGLDFLNLSGSEPRMSDNDTSFAARKQMGNVLFYKSLCRSKNLFSS